MTVKKVTYEQIPGRPETYPPWAGYVPETKEAAPGQAKAPPWAGYVPPDAVEPAVIESPPEGDEVRRGPGRPRKNP